MLRLIFLFIVSPAILLASDRSLLSEDFNNLDRWKPLLFPKIKEHSSYVIEKENNLSFLKCSTKQAASGLILKNEFNINEYPVIQWRWKVNNVYQQGDATKKSGDDYPIRIYVIFKYDPDQAGFFEGAKYSLAKTIYGEYPPDSSLNYIWANKLHKNKLITSPYTDRAKMLVVDASSKELGRWRSYRRNILQDYQQAFNKAPPVSASLAIMCDSDNTQEAATSFIDYLKITKE